MNRAIPIGAALAALVFFVPSKPTAAPLPMLGVCENVYAVEPLVVFDVSGYSLLGPIHEHLTVYSNGLASISNASASLGEPGGSAAVAFLPAAEAVQLARDLYLAGAWDICDDPTPVSDTPMTTVTVLRGTTNAPSHTFSYFAPLTPETQAVSERIAAFIAEHFPEL